MTKDEASSSGVSLGLFAGGLAIGGLAALYVVQPSVPDDEPTDSYPVEARLPLEALRDPEVGSALLSLARSTIAGRAEAAPVLSGLQPRPAVVCAYRPPALPLCRRAESQTLAGAVEAAAEQVAEATERALPQRVGVDVEVLDRVVSFDEPGYRRRDPGLWGYRAGDAVLPPSAVLARDVYGGDDEDKEFQRDQLHSQLALQLPREQWAGLEELPLHRFRTVAWVEDGTGGALNTYRLHARDPVPVTADVLAERAIWAADHLASTVSPTGRVRYLYDVSGGMEARGYNMLRHGGTTYALLQAYQRFEHEPWLRASEKAIDYLLAHSRRDVRQGPYGGGEVLWVDESRWIKLGGAGLALVMLTQHAQATGSDEHLEDARAYARFLVSQQQQSGEFVYFANKQVGGPARDRDSAYYPGEAILGLAQLYAIDPDPLWLDTARRGADWLIDVRDAGKGPKDLANDHWLMIALSHLVKHTGDERYVDHSLALAEAVAYQARRNRGKVSTHADYFGSYYDPPRSTPAATRGEGLVAVLDTCALVDRDCGEVLSLLQDTVTHELWAQYTPATVWWVPRPGDVVGGFSGGVMDPDLRNDFTQHNLSSVLGTERHLRSKRLLPGGPTWSWQAQEPYTPADAASPTTRLAPLHGIRGLHRWDVDDAAPADVDPPP